MKDFVEVLNLDWRNGFLLIAGLIIVATFLIQKTDWIIERLGLTSKRQLAEDKQNKDIQESREHAKRSDENFAKICSSIDDLKNSIKDVSSQVKKMQDKQDETERNRLRDRIGQSYRYYSAKGEWTHLEQEAFEGLIQSYEAAGGTNGKVHQVIIPASMKWKMIDE